MNCKQGDLAVIVRSVAGNEGKVVCCVRYAGIRTVFGKNPRPCWEVDRDLPSRREDGSMTTIRFIADSSLRPLRPDEGPDETLEWAGRPQETEVL